MKKYSLLLFMLAAAFLAKAQQEVVVDANAEVRTINGSFHAIKVWGGLDLYLSQSENESIAVSASEERFRSEIKTSVENGKLRIYCTGSILSGIKNRRLRVYVSFKALDKLEITGACDVEVVGDIAADALSIHLSGASDFMGAVKVNDLELNLSGASDICISGTAKTVKIESSGASDIKGYDLITDLCSATASGASDINITVNKEFSVQASGASKISYKGNALIKEIQSNGASKVNRKGS